jgi:hypothetical protein
VGSLGCCGASPGGWCASSGATYDSELATGRPSDGTLLEFIPRGKHEKYMTTNNCTPTCCALKTVVFMVGQVSTVLHHKVSYCNRRLRRYQ